MTLTACNAASSPTLTDYNTTTVLIKVQRRAAEHVLYVALGKLNSRGLSPIAAMSLPNDVVVCNTAFLLCSLTKRFDFAAC